MQQFTYVVQNTVKSCNLAREWKISCTECRILEKTGPIGPKLAKYNAFCATFSQIPSDLGKYPAFCATRPS